MSREKGPGGMSGRIARGGEDKFQRVEKERRRRRTPPTRSQTWQDIPIELDLPEETNRVLAEMGLPLLPEGTVDQRPPYNPSRYLLPPKPPRREGDRHDEPVVDFWSEARRIVEGISSDRLLAKISVNLNVRFPEGFGAKCFCVNNFDDELNIFQDGQTYFPIAVVAREVNNYRVRLIRQPVWENNNRWRTFKIAVENTTTKQAAKRDWFVFDLVSKIAGDVFYRISHDDQWFPFGPLAPQLGIKEQNSMKYFSFLCLTLSFDARGIDCLRPWPL